jgi:hypothetical protein
MVEAWDFARHGEETFYILDAALEEAEEFLGKRYRPTDEDQAP